MDKAKPEKEEMKTGSGEMVGEKNSGSRGTPVLFYKGR